MMAVRLPVQDTIYFTPPLLLLYHCLWLLMGDWGEAFIAPWKKKKKKKYTCLCSQKGPTNTHIHLKLLETSKRLITGMRLWEEKWGGAKVDLSFAWSHPVVTMGHPLLRWQWEWQAYLRGRRRAVTDWTDRAVGGCVEMTCCISIWVKNLANVAGWVRRAQRVRCFLVGWSVDFSASLRSICLFATISPSTDLCVQFARPSVSLSTAKTWKHGQKL